MRMFPVEESHGVYKDATMPQCGLRYTKHHQGSWQLSTVDPGSTGDKNGGMSGLRPSRILQNICSKAGTVEVPTHP